MTIRERIEAAYRCEPVDRVPWTVYAGLLPRGGAERCLRNRGLGLVNITRVHTVRQPHVQTRTDTVDTPRGPGTRTTHVTPVGEVHQTCATEPGYGSGWAQDHLIKRDEDYDVVEFMIRDTVYEPSYDGYAQVDGEMGDDGVMLTGLERSPLQKMWVELMGAERFGIDMLLEPDRFWRLAQAIADKQREMVAIVADGPGPWIWMPENLTAPLVGKERFRQHMLPWYNEVCDRLHAGGKRAVAHLDGLLAPIVDDIADTKIDVIEAFTPTPDGDVSMAQARHAWPDKCLSLNFPSSVHLRAADQVRAVTEQILSDNGGSPGLVIGVTENIPAANWQTSLAAIGDVVDATGRTSGRAS